MEGVTAELSHMNGILIVVKGFVKDPAMICRRFHQSFFLVLEGTDVFVILNDVLDVFLDSQGEDTSDNTTLGTDPAGQLSKPEHDTINTTLGTNPTRSESEGIDESIWTMVSDSQGELRRRKKAELSGLHLQGYY